MARTPTGDGRGTETPNPPTGTRRTRMSRAMLCAGALAAAGAIGVILIYALGSARPPETPSAPGLRSGDETAGGEALAVVHVRSGSAEHDFGYVEPESKSSVVFGIENTSSGPLRVRRIRSGCPCMKLPDPPKVIEHPGVTWVRVDLEAPKDPISYSEKVIIQTDAPKDPLIVFRIKASVGLPLELKPAAVNLGDLVLGERRRGTLTIINHGRQAVRPVYATSSDVSVAVQVPRASVPARGSLELPLLVRAANGSAGARHASVHIHTDGRRQPSLAASVEYAVSTEFALSQGAIDLGSLAPGQTRKSAFKITASRDEPGQFITGCSVQPLHNAAATAAVTYGGKSATVSCDVTAGGEAGEISGAVRLQLAGRESPVEVRITGRVCDQDTISAKHPTEAE